MDCSAIPMVNYAAFSKSLHESITRGRIPVGGSIDVTSRCNYRCIHCYVKDNASSDLPTSEIKRMLDEFADAGCLWLLLTGGEPLLRKDFPEIYTYAKKRGFLVTVFTNGALVDEEIVKLFTAMPPFAVEVSIYGATAATYETITGVPDSLSKSMRGVDLLLRHGIPLRLKTMLLRENLSELDDMMKVGEAAGIEFRYDALIHGRVDGSFKPHNSRLTAEEIVKVDLHDKRRIAAIKQLADYINQFELDAEYLFHCGAGISSFHINSRGELCLCMMVQNPSFDLSRHSFATAWNELVPKVRFQKAGAEYTCTSCDLYAVCGQCPGWGVLDEGNRNQSSSFLCRVAHLRAEAYSLGTETLGQEKQSVDPVDHTIIASERGD